MAGLSFPVVHAVAQEVVDQVDTVASVLTRVPVALVHVCGTSNRNLILRSHVFKMQKSKIPNWAVEPSATTQEPLLRNEPAQFKSNFSSELERAAPLLCSRSDSQTAHHSCVAWGPGLTSHTSVTHTRSATGGCRTIWILVALLRRTRTHTHRHHTDCPPSRLGRNTGRS